MTKSNDQAKRTIAGLKALNNVAKALDGAKINLPGACNHELWKLGTTGKGIVCSCGLFVEYRQAVAAPQLVEALKMFIKDAMADKLPSAKSPVRIESIVKGQAALRAAGVEI